MTKYIVVKKRKLMRPDRLMDCLIEDDAGQADNSGVPDRPGSAGLTRGCGPYRPSEQIGQHGLQGTSSATAVAVNEGNGETLRVAGMLNCALIFLRLKARKKSD